MNPTKAAEMYAEIKTRHVKYLDELKIVDANLVRIRPLLDAEKSFNKGNGTNINFIKDEFRVTKDEQLRLYGILKKINEELRVVRPFLKGAQHKVSKVNNKKTQRVPTAKQLARQQAKVEREATRQAEKEQRKASREQAKAERQARLEAMKEEKEFNNKPACGYNIPLLSDTERKLTNFMMKNVFTRFPTTSAAATERDI